MSKFKIGDRVRDISVCARQLSQTDGTIVGKDEGDNWEIEWKGSPYGRINWRDDQIEHFTEGPVRTETIERKVIVEGVYGRVAVDSVRTKTIDVSFDNSPGCGGAWSHLTGAELRETAATFIAIAEALESNK